MAVVLYRGDEQIRVEPKRMQSYFDQGWALNRDGKLPGQEPQISEPEKEKNILREMGILPSLNNRVIGATAIPV